MQDISIKKIVLVILHGYGMRKQNLPTDHWIDRFYEWLEVEGIIRKNADK